MKKTINTEKGFLEFAYLTLLCIFGFFDGFYFLGTRGAWILAIAFIVVVKQFLAKQIRFDLPFIFTAFFSIMLFACRTFFGSFEFAYLAAYGITPIIMYMLGRESANTKREFALIMISIVLGHTAFAGGNALFSFPRGGNIDPNLGTYAYFNFWTGEYLPRTFFSIELTILCGLGAALLFSPFKKGGWYLRAIGCLMIAGYLISASFLGIRSPIVIVPIVVLIVALYSLYLETSTKKRIVYCAFLCAFGILFVLFWVSVANNIFGLKDFLMAIPGFSRFISAGGGDSDRIHQYEVFAENWLKYPVGGMYRAGLLGNDIFGRPMYFHNGFLQVYTHGGFPLTIVVLFLLFFFIRQVIHTKRTPENGFSLTLSVSVVISIFSICMIEPMITSGPFIFPYVFLAGGFLAGQLGKQKQKKPLFVIGLNDWQENASFSNGNLLKLILFVVFGLLGGALVSLTSGSPFYAISMLAASVLMFLLLDKTQYNVISWIKTAISFAFATSIILLEFYLLPNPSLVFSIAKVMIGFFAYLLIRVIVIQKHDSEDGYRAFRNLFIRISKDASLPEENLVN